MAQEIRAVAKYVRISPRKVRIVMDLIRGKDVSDALAILKFTPKRGAVLTRLLPTQKTISTWTPKICTSQNVSSIKVRQ